VEATTPHRLLLVLSNLGTGGAEWQVRHLARGLALRGDDVTVCALGRILPPVDALTSAGVRTLALGAVGPRARLLALPTLTRLARRADVVHCTSWDATLYGRIAALLARRPVVVSDHATDRSIHVSRRGAPRGRWVAAHHRVLGPLTAATVVCARSQHELLVAEGVPRDRVAHIPNGIPLDEVRAAAGRGPSRTELGIPDDALVVVHVAHFRPEKNQEQTLESVAALRGALGDVRAVFVGTGPREAELRARAQAMGADWATFLGRRTDAPGVMALADLLVLPSRADTMPMTILEALALGVPVVAYDVGDVGSVLAATGGGVCVAHLDGAAFTAACGRLLADERLRQELSDRGRRGAAGYDADTMVRRYADVFASALPGRPARQSRLRVAQVGPDLHGRGGMPAVMLGLFASPLAERHQLDFIATYGTATYGDADPWRRAATFAAGLARLVAWSLRGGRRLVHIHTATRGSWYRKSVCVLAARATGRPVILHVHAGPGDIAAFCERIGPVRRRLFAWAFGAADRVVSVSNAGAREIERGLGVHGIITVPNAAPSRHPAAAARSGPDRDVVEVLYLGGFANPAKGGDVLVEALPELLAAAPQVSVTMAGLGAAPGLRGAAGRARWLGWLERDDAAGALAAADIVVLPSLSEGVPVVLLEARSLGKAVVATDAGGIPEVISDGIDGLLVAPGDRAALARAVARLAGDPALRARLGAAAARRADRLGDEEVYQRLDDLYHELAPAPSCAGAGPG
jgi:glycosyltransferase involved in cell wall biosynthesis